MNRLSKYLKQLIDDIERTWQHLPIHDCFAGAQPIPLPVTVEQHQGPRHDQGYDQKYSSIEHAVAHAVELQHILTVFGEPGAGKTSATKWLARHFALIAVNAIDDLNQPIPVWVDLGGYSNQTTSLAEILVDAAQDLPKEVSGRPAIWLLDGLDLLLSSSRSDAGQFLREAERHIRRTRDYIIVSSRPLETVKRALDERCETVWLRIHRLSTELRENWLNLYCPDVKPAYEQFVRDCPHATAFLDVPLLFAMLLSAMIDSTERDAPFRVDRYSGRAGLFDGFINYAIRRARGVDSASFPHEVVAAVFYGAIMEGAEDRLELDQVHAYLSRANRDASITVDRGNWNDARTTLIASGLIQHNESTGELLVLHQQFAEFWGAKHLAQRIETATVGGWRTAELWKHFDQQRLDSMTGMALSIIEGGPAERPDFLDACLGELGEELRHDQITLLAQVGSPSAIKPLLGFLRDESLTDELRGQAARKLGELGSGEAAAPLIEFLNDKSVDEEARMWAGIALGEIGVADAVRPIMDFLRDEEVDLEIRELVAEQLGRINSTELVPMLIKNLLDKTIDEFTRGNCAFVLGFTRSKHAIQPLVEVLQDRSTSDLTRMDAATSLGQIGTSEALDALVEAFMEPEAEEEFCSICLKAIVDINGTEVTTLLMDLFREAPTLIHLSCLLDVLGEQCNSKIVGPLVDILRDDLLDPLNREYAAEALQNIGTPEVFSLLTGVMRDNTLDNFAHFLAALSLGRLGSNEVALPLIKFLLNRSIGEEYRSYAASTLGELGCDEAVGPIIEFLLDKSIDNFDREQAAWSLGKLGTAEATAVLKQVFQDESNAIRLRVVAVFAIASDEAVEPLLEVLYDKSINDPLRDGAAKALKRLGSAKAITSLISALSDKSIEDKHRDAVADLMQRLGSIEAVEPLIEVLQDKSTEDKYRATAASALGQLGSDKAIELLIEVLQDKSTEDKCRTAAVSALGQLGSDKAIEPLFEVLHDKSIDYSVRQAAVGALVRIDSANAFAPILELIQDKSVDFRKRRSALIELCRMDELKKEQLLSEFMLMVDEFEMISWLAWDLGQRLCPPSMREKVEMQTKNREQALKGEHVMAIFNNPIFNQCIMNIESNLNNVRQTIQALPIDQDEAKQTLAELAAELKQVPPEHAAKAEELTDLARGMADESGKEKPNRSVLTMTKKGLIEAAEALATVVPKVLPLATQLAKLLAP